MELNSNSIETSIAEYFNINSFNAGGHVVRNEKGWRDNEIIIEYSWIVTIVRSFIGWGGVFFIKCANNEFRGINNPEKLIKGAFIFGNNGKAVPVYIDEEFTDFADPIKNIEYWDLFDANQGITLDGVTYELTIYGKNIKTSIAVNNPTSVQWKRWEETIWVIGQDLAGKAENIDLISLFKK